VPGADTLEFLQNPFWGLFLRSLAKDHKVGGQVPVKLDSRSNMLYYLSRDFLGSEGYGVDATSSTAWLAALNQGAPGSPSDPPLSPPGFPRPRNGFLRSTSRLSSCDPFASLRECFFSSRVFFPPFLQELKQPLPILPSLTE